MKSIFLLVAALGFMACAKQPVKINYAVSYYASHADGWHDGVAVVSCDKKITESQAKLSVRNTLGMLEGRYFDTSKITIIEIKPVSDEELRNDSGYRNAGCGCDGIAN